MEFKEDRADQPREYLTPQQVSDILQVPLSTLAVWRGTGRVRLPFIKIGHAIRYRRSELESRRTGLRSVAGSVRALPNPAMPQGR
jgi:hypothetical protein